jgi:sentrin-specific protease 1
VDPQYNHSQISHWTGRRQMSVDFASMEFFFLPVNVDNYHWYLICADMIKKQVRVYDSGTRFTSKESRLAMMHKLTGYIGDELCARKTGILGQSDWSYIEHKCNQQTNIYDCGVFTVMNADFISNDCPLWFNQTHITHFRNKIASDIIRGRVLH